jgi:two-component sensor histidine kinase
MGENAFEMIRPYIDRVLKGERVEDEAELPWSAHGPSWIHVSYGPHQESDANIGGWVEARLIALSRTHDLLARARLGGSVVARTAAARTRAVSVGGPCVCHALDGRDFEISPKTALALGQAKRRGFGLTMIERGLSLEPDGPVELDFAQTGLVCRIEIPLRNAEPWRVG